jgi:hypothetical protein
MYYFEINYLIKKTNTKTKNLFIISNINAI